MIIVLSMVCSFILGSIIVKESKSW
jgi:hypothetical protein